MVRRLLYYDLLEAVYERNYAGNKHDASRYLKFEEFLEVLEEIALAVWHSDGRTASEKTLLKSCEDSGLKPHLEKFSKGAEKGVVRLLTAFYFRQHDKDSSGDRTFEFTHKSFGEYLTARRIVGAVDSISQEVIRNQKNSRIGWNHAAALEEWIKITGPMAIDNYILKFIQDEIELKGELSAIEWQKVYIDLLSTVIKIGSPMDKIGLSSFSEMLKQSANSEVALLLIHYACSLQTKLVLDINLGDSFDNWLTRVQSQSGGGYASSALANLNLTGVSLGSCNLLLANLSNSQLENSSFLFTALCLCQLDGANLKHSRFHESNLWHADFQRATLDKTSFKGSRMGDTNFQGATLENVNFEGTDLTGANFAGVNLESSSFKGANLKKVDFTDANLEKADFTDANLLNAKLEGAKYEITNFTGANLQGTILEGKDC